MGCRHTQFAQWLRSHWESAAWRQVPFMQRHRTLHPPPEAVPATIGLVQQAASLGQFAGPVILGLWVEHYSWTAPPIIVVPAALLGVAAAFVLRSVLTQPKIGVPTPLAPTQAVPLFNAISALSERLFPTGQPDRRSVG